MAWRPIGEPRRWPALLAGGTLALTAAASPAAADCQIYQEPDACTMVWQTDDGFWVGEYAVEAGVQFMTMNGRNMAGPPAPMASATFFQFDGNLVIHHPERVLQADLVSMDLDEPAWDWGAGLAEGMPATDLAGVEFLLDCTNVELPRWHAEVLSDDGVPMNLDLVAVSPLTIYGLLHVETTMQGGTISIRRMLNFTRADYPTDGLELESAGDESCALICADEPFLCVQ